MSVPGPTPCYFGEPERQLFGWLHQPGVAGAATGLVLCNPFGYDAVSAHRSYRHLAEQAANAGIPALRFDFYSAGDSAGNDTDEGLLAAWIASVGHAVRALREHAAVSQVCLFGMRLGALIALLAAQELPDVTALIALNPVLSGRRYLRELTALKAASPMAGSPSTAIQGLHEVAGFAMTDATRADVMALGVDSVTGTSIRHALLVERADLPADDSLAARLGSQGISVTRQPFGAYTEMMLDAHETVVPQQMLADSIAWLHGVASAAGTTQARSAAVSSPPATSTVMLHEGVRVRETAAFLDADRRLFGIVCEPVAEAGTAATSRHVMLLPNAGAVLHTGPNRLYVRIARTCAAAGMTVIRFDLSGLGDSAPRPGGIENIVYTAHATADIAAVREFAARLRPGAEMHLAGICSGAYHSLKSALEGPALRSIVVINPLTFFWKEGMALAQLDSYAIAEAKRYRQTSLQLASWLKLLRGRVDLLAILRVAGNRAKARVLIRLRRIAAFFHIALPDDLARELRLIASRGTDSLYVFSAFDPGLSLLREQGGTAVRQLQQRNLLRIAVVEDTDHTFTPRLSQHELLRLLTSHLAQMESNCRT